jgi:hypothetical protein
MTLTTKFLSKLSGCTPGKTLAAPMPAVFVIIMYCFILCRNAAASEQLSQAGGGRSRQSLRGRETEFHGISFLFDVTHLVGSNWAKLSSQLPKSFEEEK